MPNNNIIHLNPRATAPTKPWTPVPSPKCPTCHKSVYAAEQVLGPGGIGYHKNCLKCVNCSKILDPFNTLEHGYDPYCKICHSKCFGTKGFGYGNAVVGEYNTPRMISSPSSSSSKSSELSSSTSESSPSPSSPSSITTPSNPTSPNLSLGAQTSQSSHTQNHHHHHHQEEQEEEEDKIANIKFTPTLISTISKDQFKNQGTSYRQISNVENFKTNQESLSNDDDNDDQHHHQDHSHDFDDFESSISSIKIIVKPKPSKPIDSNDDRINENENDVKQGRKIRGTKDYEKINSITNAYVKLSVSPSHKQMSKETNKPSDLDSKKNHSIGSFQQINRSILPSSSSSVETLKASPKYLPSQKLGLEGPQKCPSCNQSVYHAEQILAIGKKWHKRCLRCENCKKPLDSNLNEREGKPYCVRCYDTKFGTIAHGFVLKK